MTHDHYPVSDTSLARAPLSEPGRVWVLDGSILRDPADVPGHDELSDVSVHVFMLDGKAMIDLGYKNFVFESTINVYYFVMDVMAYRAGAKVVESSNGRFLLERRGVGFRIAIGAHSATMKLGADTKSIAAAAQLGMAQTRVQADVLGLPDIDPRQIPVLSNLHFDATFMKNLGHSIAYLVDHLADPGTSKEPVPVDEMILSRPRRDAERALRSRILALHRIYFGKTLVEALDHGRRHEAEHLEASAVAEVYEYFKIVDRPDRATRDTAGHLLAYGRF